MEKKSKKKGFKENLVSSKYVDYIELKALYDKLKKHIEIIEKNKRNIPLSVFSSELSCLETIVKYSKENLKLDLKEISVILGRSSKTIWQAYNSSKKKYPSFLVADDFALTIPISLFKDRRLSILEHIVSELRKRGMKFSDIARTLKRDPRTIWTVCSRAKKKMKND